MTTTKIMVMMICVKISCVYNSTSTQDWIIMVGFVIISVEYLVVHSKELAFDDWLLMIRKHKKL
jgi:hypothetical protein